MTAPDPGTDGPRDGEGLSSTGLRENVAGLLCYLLGFVSGLVFFLIERDSAYVRFHATQSILVFLGLLVARLVAGVLPLIGTPLAGLIGLAGLVLWILLMVKAWQGKRYALPFVGEIAADRAARPRT